MGQEDCLYMNIYTPNVDLNKDELLPVVVWIYGGGFITGSGVMTEYGPEKWLDQGIVVVTLNYRYLQVVNKNRAGGTGGARGAVAPPKFSRIIVEVACLAP